MTVLLGIDPGVKGAIAKIDIPNRELWLFDIPYLKVKFGRKKARNELQEAQVAQSLRMMVDDAEGDIITTIEVQSPAAMIPFAKRGPEGAVMGGGAKSMNQQLGGYYMLRGIMTGLGMAYIHEEASVWKKAMKLSSDKEESRHAAARILPLCADAFAPGKARVDYAEATMLAIYGGYQRGLILPSNIRLAAPLRQMAKAA